MSKNLLITVGSFAVSVNAVDASTLFSVLRDAVQMEQAYDNGRYIWIAKGRNEPVNMTHVAYMLPGEACDCCCEPYDESEFPF